MTMQSPISRRQVLKTFACGIGGVGLANFFAEQGLAQSASRAQTPHHPPRARSIIFLMMSGGPSQFETFDYKPAMNRYAGMNITVDGARVIGNNPVMPSQWRFRKCGQGGLAIAEIFPHTATCADELCVIKSMYCDDNNHPGGQRQIHTGFSRIPRPHFGSWILYGLGSENRNLPGFVYLADGIHHGSGFLPAQNQGMPLSYRLPNLRRPNTITQEQQRGQLDLLNDLNTRHASERDQDNDLNARIEAGELAFRMQMAAPDALDLTHESAMTQRLYGMEVPEGRAGGGRGGLTQTTAQFGAMCLTARRLVERGVRVVTIDVGGRRGWDQHGNLRVTIAHNARVVDQGMAGLLKDLKSRGLLDSTLVLWGGEFGRTPNMQSLAGDSRAHHTHGYTMWLAGGGVKGGMSYGVTDELGRDVVADKVHVHGLHATILWLLGLDHERLTYRYAGRDQRLTDVHGHVVRGIFA